MVIYRFHVAKYVDNVFITNSYIPITLSVYQILELVLIMILSLLLDKCLPNIRTSTNNDFIFIVKIDIISNIW